MSKHTETPAHVHTHIIVLSHNIIENTADIFIGITIQNNNNTAYIVDVQYKTQYAENKLN